jgi:hypothetical protein
MIPTIVLTSRAAFWTLNPADFRDGARAEGDLTAATGASAFASIVATRRRRRPMWNRGLFVVLALFVCSAEGSAQVITGTVEGRVRDSHGAMLPGVTVTARNRATAAATSAVTTSEGLYRIPFLSSGTYDVTAELSGFRTEVRQAVTVRVNDSAVLDFDLAVAPVAETVVVEGGSQSVQLTRSDIKRNYDEAALKEIPLLTSDATGRNVYTVATRAQSDHRGYCQC